jgi:Zn-dependent peptidase ImmA (M78 family)
VCGEMPRAARRRKGSDRFLVERFAEWIPGWGRRQLCLADLTDYCEQHRIEIVFADLEDADGYALWASSAPYIYIARHLRGPEKVITGYHELAHILYHPPHPEIFRRTGNLWNWSKCDRQAEIVGELAWMPDVAGLSIDQVMARFSVSREVAEFRLYLSLWPVQHHSTP